MDFILGGGYLQGVYWFISCLFFTQIAASLIIQYTSRKIYLILIAGLMYYFSAMLTLTNTVFFYGTPQVFLNCHWLWKLYLSPCFFTSVAILLKTA